MKDLYVSIYLVREFRLDIKPFHLKQILSYSRNKNVFDTIGEGAWELPSHLFLIFCRFHVNNDDITIVMRHACERAWSI